MQAAGIDPYRYAPGARQLSPARPLSVATRRPVLRGHNGPTSRLSQVAAPPPAVRRRPRARLHADQPAERAHHLPTGGRGLLHRGGRVVAGRRRSLPIQAAGALCAIATSFLLVTGLRRLGRDPRLAVLWAWCPVVGFEAGNGAHIDVLAAFLTVAALLVLARPGGRLRAASGGLLLGLAIATKITPILAGPRCCGGDR